MTCWRNSRRNFIKLRALNRPFFPEEKNQNAVLVLGPYYTKKKQGKKEKKTKPFFFFPHKSVFFAYYTEKTTKNDFFWGGRMVFFFIEKHFRVILLKTKNDFVVGPCFVLHGKKAFCVLRGKEKPLSAGGSRGSFKVPLQVSFSLVLRCFFCPSLALWVCFHLMPAPPLHMSHVCLQRMDRERMMHVLTAIQMLGVLGSYSISAYITACLVLSCHVLSCLVLSCLVLSCLVLSCLQNPYTYLALLWRSTFHTCNDCARQRQGYICIDNESIGIGVLSYLLIALFFVLLSCMLFSCWL